jgi:hypothetical protein
VAALVYTLPPGKELVAATAADVKEIMTETKLARPA